ncbi:P pilus assembly protein, chaperone PapD [Izhakiella capsodis]|uniref:P pilus assembly protein, chaperone PapD n=1 Tax=Izhakiella capsodis TaxID=1367852 RepID=A0A1I4ZYH7_9GAMM|nr:fimbria/pilus periplasmic chaperone [Izhakiella capsodis]SFN55226.1 P pilus assembly protein, chaperone PapD [Izhakiella capsodis]
MIKPCFTARLYAVLILSSLIATPACAALELDRTRVIFNGGDSSMSLSVTNENKALPYLAQAWVEDPQGHTQNLPLTALPPIQRIEPGAQSQVILQALPSVKNLPQDRESLFYFNLREIPPRSNKPDTLQLALQTRIKLFYRPATLRANNGEAPWQNQLTLTAVGNHYRVNNPTGYYITLVEAQQHINGPAEKTFSPLMVSPDDSMALTGVTGSAPVLTYINDYGGDVKLAFHCTGKTCAASSVQGG